MYMQHIKVWYIDFTNFQLAHSYGWEAAFNFTYRHRHELCSIYYMAITYAKLCPLGKGTVDSTISATPSRTAQLQNPDR